MHIGDEINVIPSLLHVPVNTMMQKIKSFIHSELFKYCIVGGTTTLVDLAVFYLLCEVGGMNATLSNVISISVSIAYAYVANKLFVFQTHCPDLSALMGEIGRFVSGRLGTMALEIGMVFVLCDLFGMDGFAGKLTTQVVIFVSNYMLSKFWAFKSK